MTGWCIPKIKKSVRRVCLCSSCGLFYTKVVPSVQQYSTYELACTQCTKVYSPLVPQLYKKSNSNKCTAAHRDTCGALWTSGDAQTPAELISAADIHRCVCVSVLSSHLF